MPRKRITLDLTGFAERHRARCRELGIPEDTPWPEREARGREKRRREERAYKQALVRMATFIAILLMLGLIAWLFL